MIIESVGNALEPAQIATLCGTGQRGMALDGDAASTAKLNNPYGMAEKKDAASLYFVPLKEMFTGRRCVAEYPAGTVSCG